MRHEYAETAIDVIARRCRLSFLNAQAALDALPRVVEVMAEEAHWTPARAKAETDAATKFLLTMGLMPGAAPRPISHEPKGVVECVETALGMRHARRRRAAQEMVYSRAQFDAGEVEAFRRAFEARATLQVEEDRPKLETAGVYDLVKGLPGFDGVRPKDYDYVMEEVGYARGKDVDFDEFVEVSFFVHMLWSGYLIVLRFHRSAPSFAKCCSHPRTTRRVRRRGGGYLLRRAVGVSKANPGPSATNGFLSRVTGYRTRRYTAGCLGTDSTYATCDTP